MEVTAQSSLIDYIGQLKTLQTSIQIGELISLSPKTLSQWAKQGRIPVIRMGSALRFDPVAIAAWLTERAA